MPRAPLDPEQLTKVLHRGRAALLLVAVFSGLGVYLGHGWFHGVFLPMLGISARLGDTLGGLFIIVVAYGAQRLVSLAVFRETQFGLKQYTAQLMQSSLQMQGEIDQLSLLAGTDKLTGCWNRRRLEETAAAEIERVSRYGQALSLLVLDIDCFKAINDGHGHNVGDQVLLRVASLLRPLLRATDSLTRWGGEEFIVLCPGIPLATAIQVAERLRREIEATPFEQVGRVTASIGVAEFLADEEWRDWLERADQALYRAKHGGRNQVQFDPQTPEGVGPGAEAGIRLVQLVWQSLYESGHELIDREHRHLFAVANRLLNAIVSDAPAAEVRQMVGGLMDDIAQHFRDEEQALAQLAFPGLEEHAGVHRALLEKASRLVDDMDQGRLEAGALFQFLAYDVVAKHILGADRQYAAHVKAAVGRALAA